eukprot:scaffold95798_cov57-Phaeocystis_antarctica.AAC.2
MWELGGKSGNASPRGGGRDHGKGQGSDQTPIAAAARGMGRGGYIHIAKERDRCLIYTSLSRLIERCDG